MPTLTSFAESVNGGLTPGLGDVALTLLALFGLVMLAAAARLLRYAFAVVVQLVQTLLVVGLVIIIVLAVVFAAGYTFAVGH